MGKNNAPKKTTRFSKRTALLVLSLVMILSVTAGGTLAYLKLSAEDVTNTFTPGEITTTIEEEFDKEEKTDVRISNEKSNLDVKVRAKVVITWVDKDGNTLAEKPVKDVDYLIRYNESDWTQTGGYWYCTNVVKAETKSPILIESCQPVKDMGPAGARLQVTILSQSIQATEAALEDVHWADKSLTD